MSALIQQTDEWLEMRKNHIGASDAPVIMLVSPWKTPAMLWEEKMGIKMRVPATEAMNRGLQLEEKARVEFEKETGIYVFPQILKHPKIEYMIASLDGIDIEHKNIVEIKCVNREDHAIAKSGNVPEKYYPQMQHQMEVCELDQAYYYSFDGEKGVIVIVKRDDKYIEKMIKKEDEFYECMQDFVAPPLTERDYVIKNDNAWIVAAKEYIDLQTKMNSLEERQSYLRSQLIDMSNNRNCRGSGIKLQRIVRRGSVDYSKIVEIIAVDVEKYRKAPVETWRITEEK